MVAEILQAVRSGSKQLGEWLSIRIDQRLRTITSIVTVRFAFLFSIGYQILIYFIGRYGYSVIGIALGKAGSAVGQLSGSPADSNTKREPSIYLIHQRTQGRVNHKSVPPDLNLRLILLVWNLHLLTFCMYDAFSKEKQKAGTQ